MLTGGDGDDRITFGSEEVGEVYTIYGEAGNDTIIAAGSGLYVTDGAALIGGGEGNDLIYGGYGDDTIYGGFGSDHIYGGAGDDIIYASAGSGNQLGGSSGNDTLVASTGRDLLYGGGAGTGHDVFVFYSAAHIGIRFARDRIEDFVSKEHKIDLRALETSFNGQLGLKGGGEASFFHYDNPDYDAELLIGDQNGDGIADWVLAVKFQQIHRWQPGAWVGGVWQSGYYMDMAATEFELSDFLL